MYINSVELSNFRNYENLKIVFSKGINILYGDNAQGKTNILESIYVSGTSKSHKNCKDREMIMISREESHIRTLISKDGIIHKIDLHLKKHKSKGIAIDGLTIKKTSELMGILPVILFSPEDLSIIKNGPGERRRFLDMELCQTDRIYYYNLSQYNKILYQRNKLLKQISFNKDLIDTLEVWDKQLLSYGIEIITIRRKFIEELNQIICNVHDKITDGREAIELKYAPDVLKEEFEDKLISGRERDLYLKSTGCGPHRDDMFFYINGQDIRKFGSQGQQRTAALSLKLSEISLMKEKIKDSPVLLLDDVFSELDRKRQNHLLKSLEGTQTIITCTGMEEFVKQRMIIDKVYRISNGIAVLEEKERS